MKWLYSAIFLVLIVGFFFEFHLVGQTVYGDGRYYFAFTRALYFSHNIDISSEIAHYYSPKSNNEPASFSHVAAYAGKTKEVTNSFSLGISILWLPFYALADLIVQVGSLLGLHWVRNGYSDIYQITVGIGNILFIMAGLVIIGRLLRQWYSTKVVMLSLLLMLFATNLFYYASLDVVNSHPLSFFLVSLLLLSFFHFRKQQSIKNICLQGLIVGLLGSNRTEDLLFVLFPFVSVVLYNKHRMIDIKKIIATLSVFIALIIGYLPQLLLLYFSQGKLVLLPHTDQKFSLLPIHAVSLLFDPKLGIVYYMPIVLFALFGLFFLKKRSQLLAALFSCIFLLHFLLISSWSGWSQASYSMRYFISTYPLIIFGMAELITRLQKYVSSTFLYLCAAIFISHELMMMVGFKLFLQDPTMVGASLSRSGKLKLAILHRIKDILAILK